MAFIPIPIIMPHPMFVGSPAMTSGGGNDTIDLCIWIFIGLMYFCQLIFVYGILLFEPDEFKTKLNFLWWHVPFAPLFVTIVKKISKI